MDHLENWLMSFLSQPSLKLTRNVAVKGSCKKHLGPRLEYAIIDVVVEPSDHLLIELSEGLSQLDSHVHEMLESAIFGILDVILVTKPIPLRDVKIDLISADVHPVDSNNSAFRKARRDAGRQIMEAIG